MTDERSSHIENSNDVDKHTAATLAAALIAHGLTLPAATNAAMAAEQAVDLYRTVLKNLRNLQMGVERASMPTPVQAISSREKEEMDILGVSRIDSAKFCFGDYRYDNLSDALRYARAKSQATST